MAPLTDISRAYGQQSAAEPISRTMQYRKITKPLLERQRRARINRCLDELKEILVSGLQNEGENVARLEKADILEMAVKFLKNLTGQQAKQQQQQSNIGDDEKYLAGFAHCAQEISRVMATTPRVDVQVGSSLMIHLGHTLNQIKTSGKGHRISRPSSVCSNSSSSSSSSDYRPYTPPASPTSSESGNMSPLSLTKSSPWRPW